MLYDQWQEMMMVWGRTACLMEKGVKIKSSVSPILCSWWATRTWTFADETCGTSGFCLPSSINPHQMNQAGAAVLQNLPVYHTLSSRGSFRSETRLTSLPHSLGCLFPGTWRRLLNINVLVRWISKTSYWDSELLITSVFWEFWLCRSCCGG